MLAPSSAQSKYAIWGIDRFVQRRQPDMNTDGHRYGQSQGLAPLTFRLAKLASSTTKASVLFQILDFPLTVDLPEVE